MNTTEHDLLQAAGDLQNGNITETTLGLIRQLVRNGFSSELIGKATHVDSQTDQCRELAISKTMACLEAIAEIDRSLACILMSDLWSLASDTMVHDICDAIDLWLWESDSDELRQHLERLVFSIHDPDIKRHFQHLVESKSK